MLTESSVRQAFLKSAAFVIAAALFIFFALSTVSSSRSLADNEAAPEATRSGTTNFTVANPQNCSRYLASVVVTDAAQKKQAAVQESKVINPDDANGSGTQTR